MGTGVWGVEAMGAGAGVGAMVVQGMVDVEEGMGEGVKVGVRGCMKAGRGEGMKVGVVVGREKGEG